MQNQLKDEIEKYRKFTDYMAETAVVGAKVGFVRKLIEEVESNKKYQPPELPMVQTLLTAAQNTAYPVELRNAINGLLANVSDLQGQVRGMRIEEARSKELSHADA